MNVVESQWWIIDLPPEWQAEQDEETIIISDQDGVGEIAITTLEKATGDVDDKELGEFTAELVKEGYSSTAVTVSELSGYYYSYQDSGDAVRDWYLRSNNILVLITYSCAQENAGMDDAAVNEIINTIFIKNNEE